MQFIPLVLLAVPFVGLGYALDKAQPIVYCGTFLGIAYLISKRVA